MSSDSQRNTPPSQLRAASIVVRTLAYAAGLTGAVVGLVIWQEGDTLAALAVWVATFCIGALLMAVGFLLEALTSLLARVAAMESDLRVLLGRSGPDTTGHAGNPHTLLRSTSSDRPQ